MIVRPSSSVAIAGVRCHNPTHWQRDYFSHPAGNIEGELP
jgi:hypothetical protein